MQIEQAYAHYIARTPLEGFSNEEILHVRRFFLGCRASTIGKTIRIAKDAFAYEDMSDYNIQKWSQFCKKHDVRVTRETLRGFRKLRGKLE